MKICVLLSCMYQTDYSIIEKSNIQSDVVVVNQCDVDDIVEFDFENKYGKICHVKFISTQERGLSKSRNMAIRNTSADICLIADDDEYFFDGYEDRILSTFQNDYKSDFIAFKLEYAKKFFSEKEYKIKFFDVPRLCSVQMAFRRDKIIKEEIFFDELMGSGSGNGSGEEIKFAMQCFKRGLKMKYIPILIAKINEGSESRWFKGYTVEYFKNLGWSSRRIFGLCWGIIYLFYHALSHQKLYSPHMSFWGILKYLYLGFFEKRQ